MTTRNRYYKMSVDNLPVLTIGDLKVSPPIIQAGMGVRVSRANLASAVASQGCVGVIASVGLGRFEHLPRSEAVRVNEEALRHEIQQARRQTNGIIGVNVMVALTDYENQVRASIAAGVQLGTRFVCTVECDVHEDFKKAHLASEKEDIIVIRSPVGLPWKGNSQRLCGKDSLRRDSAFPLPLSLPQNVHPGDRPILHRRGSGKGCRRRNG